MICVVIKGPLYSDAHKQIANALAYANLVELRFDLFHCIDLPAIEELRKTFSIPMIFTLRTTVEGGNYHLPETKRLDDLKMLASLTPEYLDIEHHVSPSYIEELTAQYPLIKLIISYHNFSETPQNLDALYAEMTKIPAHYYKMALTANSSIDVMRFICWAKALTTKIIAISMGNVGQISRILAPIIGNPFTYASLEDDSPIAPGQLSAKTLTERYYFNTLNSQTSIYGLIGNPINLSMSDITHNAFFKSQRFNAVYVKIAVLPSELGDFLHFAKQLPFSGLSVTMPLKETILPFLDEIDDHAKQIGAVNTVMYKNGQLQGSNTDGIGALDAISTELHVKGKHIIVLGAGGAAKAIITEASQRGSLITILNRNVEKAQQIASRFNCQADSLDNLDKYVERGYDVLINCTPIDTQLKASCFQKNALIMDIRSNPQKTIFLTSALEQGCRVIYGYQMFIRQALGQFQLWFGDIPKAKCLRLLEEKATKRKDESCQGNSTQRRKDAKERKEARDTEK